MNIQTLVYLGTDTPVPRGAPLYDGAGREWRFRAAYKPGLSMSAAAYEQGEVVVSNGGKKDRWFLTSFFPAVEFAALPAADLARSEGQ